MFPIDDFHGCLKRVAQVLRECEVRFYITGGAAFIAYGDPRTTQDVDLVVEAEPVQRNLRLLIDGLERRQFLLNEAAIVEALHRQRQFQLIDLVSAMKIDLYPRELVPGAIDRAREIELFPEEYFPVASLPDLVISKLVWISKGSHKSRRDVRQLMRRVSTEDKALVRRLAEEAELATLLDEVLAEPDEIDL